MKAQQQLMEGARDEDRKNMANLVHREITTLHQELTNQNASHDITMMDDEVEPLALEIKELKTVVQGLKSFVHKQQNAIEQFSKKFELPDEVPQICDDMEIDKVWFHIFILSPIPIRYF